MPANAGMFTPSLLMVINRELLISPPCSQLCTYYNTQIGDADEFGDVILSHLPPTASLCNLGQLKYILRLEETA